MGVRWKPTNWMKWMRPRPRRSPPIASACSSDHKVEQLEGIEADLDAGLWTGTVDGFAFQISRDDVGDLVLDFSSQPA